MCGAGSSVISEGKCRFGKKSKQKISTVSDLRGRGTHAWLFWCLMNSGLSLIYLSPAGHRLEQKGSLWRQC